MKTLVLTFIPDEWELVLQLTISKEYRKAIDALDLDALTFWDKEFFDKLIIELEKVTGPICKGAVARIKKISSEEELLISEDWKLVSEENFLSLYKKHEGSLNFVEK